MTIKVFCFKSNTSKTSSAQFGKYWILSCWWKFDFIDLKKTLSICLKNILKWNNKGNKSIMIFLIEQVGLK